MFKEFLQAVQSIFTIAALVIGGLWGVYLYDQERTSKPQLNIDHQVTTVLLNDRYRLVHVSVVHENRGERLVRLKKGDIRLQQVLPLPRGFAEKLANAADLVAEGQTIVPWPLLCRRIVTQPLELEPNETHESVNEFVVPSRVSVLRVYTYYPNAEKGPIGWSNTTIYDIRAEEAQDETVSAAAARAPHVCERNTDPLDG